MFHFAGQPLAAEPLFRRAIAISQADSSLHTVSPMLLNNYARTLSQLDRLPDAARYAEQAYEKARRAGDEIVINQSLLLRAGVYSRLGDLDRADRMLAEVALTFRGFPPRHTAFMSLLSNRALNALNRGELGAAMLAADSAVKPVQTTPGAEDYLPPLLLRRAGVALRMHRYADAQRDATLAPDGARALVGRARALRERRRRVPHAGTRASGDNVRLTSPVQRSWPPSSSFGRPWARSIRRPAKRWDWRPERRRRRNSARLSATQVARFICLRTIRRSAPCTDNSFRSRDRHSRELVGVDRAIRLPATLQTARDLIRGGHVKFGWVVGLFVLGAAAPAAAQTTAGGPAVLGTWKFDLKQGKKSGPRTVIVRPDSSASYGDETVRWRLKADSLLLALGGEWVSYHLELGRRGKRLTLSGGDLTEPIDFDLVGPPSSRPDTVPVPPDPDAEQ